MKAATTRRPWANNVLGCFSPASFQRVGRLSHCHLVAAEMALHREGAKAFSQWLFGNSCRVSALDWLVLIALWRECPDVCTLMPHFSGLGGLDLAGPVRGLWMCNFARLAAAPSCFPNSEPNSFAVKLGATHIMRQLGG